MTTTMTEVMLPAVAEREPLVAHDAERFRRDVLYTGPVELALRPHVGFLDVAHGRFAGGAPSHDERGRAASGASAAYLSMGDWLAMLDALGLFDGDFTRLEAKKCFVWSQARAWLPAWSDSRALFRGCILL